MMSPAVCILLIGVPLVAGSVTIKRHARDWLVRRQRRDPAIARDQRRNTDALFPDAGHRRFRDNLYPAFVLALIVIPIVWLIDSFA